MPLDRQPGELSHPATLARRRVDRLHLERRGQPLEVPCLMPRRCVCQLKRLTFLGSTSAHLSGWSADSRTIHFVANAAAWYEGETRPFTVSIDGDEPRDLNLGHGRSFSYGSNGGAVLGRNVSDPARWKRYRGGTAGEVWVDGNASGDFERLPLPNGNPAWPMWIGERIYFQSDHEGIGNSFAAPDGSDLQRHTHESEYYVRFPSTDGSRIVYGAVAPVWIC